MERLKLSMKATLGNGDAHIAMLSSSLEHLSPMQVLARGYSVVRDAQGRIVRQASSLTPGDALDISLASGGVKARVESTR